MKIVLTGGCTGGHIYPALAIGDRFRKEDPSSEVIYIAKGEELERRIIPSHGYRLLEVDSTWIERSRPSRMPVTVIRTLRGMHAAAKIMKSFKPDAVVSTGSYVSMPVVFAAFRLGIPVYIHEQNGFPGVSNRLASMKARRVFLGFEAARRHFKRQDNIVYSGNPVRADFADRDRAEDRKALGIPQDDLVIMVFGGSLGSETTNEVARAIAGEYAGKPGYTIIWGTGRDYYEDIKSRLASEGFAPDNVRLSAYISDMPAQLSACDIIVCRSGALSTAETTVAGRAAIFIPSPNVTADHQYYNAKAVADAGGALIVREDGDTAGRVLSEIKKLDSDRDAVRRMSESSRKAAPSDATDIIYRTIMETYR